MYLFRLIEKMLSHEEKNKLSALNSYQEQNTTIAPIEIPHQSTPSSHKKQNSSQNSTKGKTNKKDMAYCLFADTGESFLAMHNNNKKRIFLNGISHSYKYTKEAKKANELINNEIKKKSVFLNIIKTTEDGDLIADVFLDQEKTKSLNQMLIEQNLHFSDRSFLKNDFSDMKAVAQTSKNTSSNHVLINPNNISGRVKGFGKAKYLYKAENNNSYYVTIEQHGKIVTKWGVDLERVITNENVKIDDFVELSREPSTQESKKQIWKINVLPQIKSHFNNNIDPPAIPDEQSPVISEEEYGYQEPYELNNDNFETENKKSSYQYQDPMNMAYPVDENTAENKKNTP